MIEIVEKKLQNDETLDIISQNKLAIWMLSDEIFKWNQDSNVEKLELSPWAEAIYNKIMSYTDYTELKTYFVWMNLDEINYLTEVLKDNWKKNEIIELVNNLYKISYENSWKKRKKSVGCDNIYVSDNAIVFKTKDGTRIFSINKLDSNKKSYKSFWFDEIVQISKLYENVEKKYLYSQIENNLVEQVKKVFENKYEEVPSYRKDNKINYKNTEVFRKKYKEFENPKNIVETTIKEQALLYMAKTIDNYDKFDIAKLQVIADNKEWLYTGTNIPNLAAERIKKLTPQEKNEDNQE